MSGGSMDYLGYKVKDATFREDTPERRALRKHLNKLSKALIAIEWNDSGDGADNESELIREALGDTAILEAAVQHAREAHKELGAELARVEGSWLSKEMRTPAKGFPAIKGESVDPLPVVIGCLVVIAESQDPKLASWYGRTGIVGHPCRGYAETLWQVKLGTGDELLVPESCLERVE